MGGRPQRAIGFLVSAESEILAKYYQIIPVRHYSPPPCPCMRFLWVRWPSPTYKKTTSVWALRYTLTHSPKSVRPLTRPPKPENCTLVPVPFLVNAFHTKQQRSEKSYHLLSLCSNRLVWHSHLTALCKANTPPRLLLLNGATVIY